MKHGLVTLVVIMILKDVATFKVLFIVSLFSAFNITTVKINSGVHIQKLNPPSAFVYSRWSWSCYFGLALVSSGLGLCLVTLVLVLVSVLRMWSCLHHC